MNYHQRCNVTIILSSMHDIFGDESESNSHLPIQYWVIGEFIAVSQYISDLCQKIMQDSLINLFL